MLKQKTNLGHYRLWNNEGVAMGPTHISTD